MTWPTAKQRVTQKIQAGHFGKCGKMIIKPYSIPDEKRKLILKIFMKFVDIKICGCWLWKGRIHNGYAVCPTTEGSKWAHRVSYALFKGPIAEGMHIDHICRNKTCVRPDHLKQTTPIENYQAIQRRRLRDIKKMKEDAGQTTIFNLIKENYEQFIR